MVIPMFLIISLLLLVTMIILVPQRTRFLLERAFAFVDTPFRDMAGLTGQYINAYPSRARRLLASAGISSPPIFSKIIGSVVIFSVAFISLIADLDLIVLTVLGIGIGVENKGIIASIGLNPADCIAIALVGGAAMMGIFFLDYFLPGWVPDSMTRNRLVGKILMILSAIMLVGAMFAVGKLAHVRAIASGISETAIAETIKSGQDSNGLFDITNLAQSGGRPYLYVFIAILTLVNSILGFYIIPTIAMIIVCLFMGFLLIPIGIANFISSLFHNLTTLLFNICLAVFNIFQGLLNGLNKKLSGTGNFDDSLPEEAETPTNPRRAVQDQHQNAGQPMQNRGAANVVNQEAETNQAAGQHTAQNPNAEPAANTDIDASGFNPLGD